MMTRDRMTERQVEAWLSLLAAVKSFWFAPQSHERQKMDGVRAALGEIKAADLAVEEASEAEWRKVEDEAKKVRDEGGAPPAADPSTSTDPQKTGA